MTLGAVTIRDVVNAAARNGAQLWLSGHDGPCGDTGAHELEAQPYERQPITTVLRSQWRVMDNAARMTLPDCSFEELGVWTAKRGGEFIGGGRTAVEDGNRRMLLGDTVIIPAGTVRIGVA